MIGNQSREHVEPTDRALRIGDAGDPALQRQALHQANDVDAALLQHGSSAEVDAVHAEGADPVLDAGAGTRQEAAPHPPGFRAQPQVEARRLDLPFVDVLRRSHLARADQGADLLRRQQPGRVRGRRARRGPLAVEFARLVPRHFHLL
jgi:hypothetical protein